MTKKHTDKIGGETKSIGFDFQYYFFLYKILTLKKGETVGLEVKDDVHTELNNNVNIFFQVKHSVQKNSKGEIKNLTSSDIDLWKTLFNWAKIISDVEDNRSDVKEQIEFIQKSQFVMWSNKKYSPKNLIIKYIEDLKDNTSNIETFKKDFLEFKKNTDNETIQNYIDEILNLNNVVLKAYILKIQFELGENEIIQKCKDAILNKLIPINQVDSVFAKIDSRIREDNFYEIKAGNKIQISFNDFFTRYSKYFNITRNGTLQVKPYTAPLSDKLEEQTFIKQLLEINDIEIEDVDLMAEFTRFKLCLENNLFDWHKEGLITTEEIKSYRNDAKNKWKNKFRRLIIKGNGSIKNSQQLIDELREIELRIDGNTLNTELSNGEFYYLSNLPEIGWTNDWKKYKE